jgi:hypothetical protein
MPMQMSDAAMALIATINTAFANGPAVPREALVVPGSWETRDLLRALADRGDAVDDAFIEYHFDSLAAFTPAGLRHVLPAYMKYSLEHPEAEATERIIFHLAPDNAESEYWTPRLAAFSPDQKRAVCAYLGYLETALRDEHYDNYLARARTVWGC